MLKIGTLAAGLLLLGSTGWAATGTLVRTEGRVSVQSSKSATWTAAKIPLLLRAGDKVKTGAGGRAEISWAGASKTRLGPDSILTVQEASAQRTTVMMSVGLLDAFIQKTKNHKFRVRTPTAVASIRGTVFQVKVDKTGRTQWNLFKGSLGVSDARGSQVVLQPNQRVSVSAEGIAEKPQLLPTDIPYPVEPRTEAPPPAETTPDDAANLETDKAPGLKIISITGEIVVDVDGQQTIYNAENLPADFVVPPGARVRVTSGAAVLVGRGGAVQAGQGSDFTYTATAEDGQLKDTLQANPGSTRIILEVNGHLATLDAGDRVSLVETGTATKLVGEKGTVSVVDEDGGVQEIKPKEESQRMPPPDQPLPGETDNPPPPDTNPQDAVSPSAP